MPFVWLVVLVFPVIGLFFLLLVCILNYSYIDILDLLFWRLGLPGLKVGFVFCFAVPFDVGRLGFSCVDH